MFCSSSIRSLLTRNFFFSVRSLSSSPLLSNTRFFPDSKQTLLHIPQFPSVTRFVSPINSRSSLIASFLTRLDHTMATPSKTSVHDFTVKDAKGNDVDLSAYKGKVLLIVNVASQCGLTNSNYTELSQLYEKYKGHGFEILAFPCNQFGGQEPGSNEEIVQFACTRFKAEYPIFDKVDVNGNNAAPLYKFLKSSKGGLFGDAIKWNFSKFLVDKDGNVVDRYAPTTSPLSIEKDVKKLLGIA
ncbi:putative phospholipid hydroperoxide glutathione peroxidase [Cucumis melo var. makuwa]|uniref:Glutathione peroxidase n=1 Tax=Cucumis melo var. makuwa TaxID=1194695 RepID=A0A5A7TLY7_CUCMM|nr:putative phospholipid hydroperoxide glutathione peroxidase [Cucumis melo var. makuwa]